VRAKAAVWANRILSARDFRKGRAVLRRAVDVECHIFVPPGYLRIEDLSKQKGRMATALDWFT
jgi:hypothetical protein